MKQQSSIDSAKERVPLFSARYELFVKMLRNEQKSSKTLINYSHHLALLCLHFGRLPEDIAGEEYIGYYILLLERNASGSHMRHAVFSVRKYLSQYHQSRYVFEKAIGVQMPYTWPTKVLDNAVRRTSILKHAHCHTTSSFQ